MKLMTRRIRRLESLAKEHMIERLGSDSDYWVKVISVEDAQQYQCVESIGHQVEPLRFVIVDYRNGN